MTYLLLKMAGALLLAGLLGFLFQVWNYRRRFVEVKDGEIAGLHAQIDTLTSSEQSLKKRLEKSESYGSTVEEKLSSAELRVREVEQLRLESEERSIALEAQLGSSVRATGLHEADSKLMTARVRAVEAELKRTTEALRAAEAQLGRANAGSEPPPGVTTQVSVPRRENGAGGGPAEAGGQVPELTARLARAAEKIHRLEERVERAEGALESERENKTEVEQRFQQVQQTLALTSKESGNRAEEIDDLLLQVQDLRERLGSVAPGSAEPPGVAPPLFTEPQYGKPDDLRRINGVGPKLETLLNDLGIHYFWQVSEWDSENIWYVEQQLSRFRGRVERDEWVSQAKSLAQTDGAAKKPTESSVLEAGTKPTAHA